TPTPPAGPASTQTTPDGSPTTPSPSPTKPTRSAIGIRHSRNRCTPPVLYGLISRVVDAMPPKYTRGKRLMRVRGDLHGTYSAVFDPLAPVRGRIEPGHPLGVWPESPDEASDEASDGPS